MLISEHSHKKTREGLTISQSLIHLLSSGCYAQFFVSALKHLAARYRFSCSPHDRQADTLLMSTTNTNLHRPWFIPPHLHTHNVHLVLRNLLLLSAPLQRWAASSERRRRPRVGRVNLRPAEPPPSTSTKHSVFATYTHSLEPNLSRRSSVHISELSGPKRPTLCTAASQLPAQPNTHGQTLQGQKADA